MSPAGLLLCIACAAVPPLTDDQRVRLADAVDGTDHRDDAFAALVENVRRWTPGSGDAPVRLQPDLERMLAHPETYRGTLCRLEGSLEQQAPLAPPWEGMAEWFVRDDAGRPILVYVAGLQPGRGFRGGRPVVILARFYKRVDAVARDGRTHRYPAFVGAHPLALGSPDRGWARLWAVTIPVAAMLVVFLLLLVYARRGHGPMRGRAGAGGVWTEEMDEPLPEDPAEALAELRRRAEAAD
jgi:hypothetical protein